MGAGILGKVAGLLGKGGLNPVTAGLNLGVGAVQAGLAARNRKKADALLPPAEDPMERQMLNTLRRRRRALETGTGNQALINASRQSAKTFGRNAFKSGGPVNQGFYSNLQSQTLGNIAAQSAQQYSQALGMEQSQTTSMANRKSDLSLLRSARKSAQAENQAAAANKSLALGIGQKASGSNTGGGLADLFKKKT
tara:strand:+ start:1208 stop:1792 length:585 start_codon:yes stop_codon:yes gene_type:complete